jgi:hypothetical protein
LTKLAHLEAVAVAEAEVEVEGGITVDIKIIES